MRIIICDDQSLIRDALEMLFKVEKDIKVVAIARDGAYAESIVF